ncbi:MAG: MBG domain-containing protein, partial [Burkholderiales bacterium]
AGLVSATVTDWNSNSTSINDTVPIVFSGGLTRAPGEAVAGSPYAITQGTLTANANYNITVFTGNNLTITTAPLTVTANNATRPVNQPDPPFSATYSGFQFGETPAVLTGALSLTTTAIITSPPGPYPITPSGQTSTNYAISYVDGTLAVIGGSSPQIPTGISDLATNLVVGGLQQLGSGAANGDGANCSDSNRPYGTALLTTASVWAPEACDTRVLEPVRLVAAPAAKEARPIQEAEPAPKPAPEITAALAADKPSAPPADNLSAPRQAEPRREEVTTAKPALPARRPGLRYNDVMTAVMYLDLAAVVELLDLGWWVDRPDSRGRTPLMAAALNGDVAMTRLLLQRGADPSRRAPGGSVLDYARMTGNAEVIELLLRAGAR